jgi:hypothetical protein
LWSTMDDKCHPCNVNLEQPFVSRKYHCAKCGNLQGRDNRLLIDIRDKVQRVDGITRFPWSGSEIGVLTRRQSIPRSGHQHRRMLTAFLRQHATLSGILDLLLSRPNSRDWDCSMMVNNRVNSIDRASRIRRRKWRLRFDMAQDGASREITTCTNSATPLPTFISCRPVACSPQALTDRRQG